MYASGQGVPEDDSEAVRWFRLSARQGIGAAQANLGVMYHHGSGVRKDDGRAHMWLTVAMARVSEGMREAVANLRDAVGSKLQADQRARAQAQAAACLASNFQNCGEPNQR